MIEKYAFVNLPKLKYLSLSNNPYLIHVGGKSFGHTIPGIQILKLSNNAIDLLPGGDLIGSFRGVCWLDVTGRIAPPHRHKKEEWKNTLISNDLVIISSIISATHVTGTFATNVTYYKSHMIFHIWYVSLIPENRRIKKKFTKIKVIGSYW